MKDAFPGAAGVLCEEMAAAVNRLEPTKEDLIVIMTRGHEHDYEVPVSYTHLMKAREAAGSAARRSAQRAMGRSAGDDTKGRKNMKFLNVEIPVKNLPELDQGFVPLGLFFKHYSMGCLLYTSRCV